jgi:hypothetical protein
MERAGSEHAVEGSVAPVCVTGMHRTGTSLVAGLLNRHGLWLGEEADMMPANPFNPDGYFENSRLVELDDAVLAAFGGSWDSPPDFPASWPEDERLAHIKDRARAQGERLDAHRPWGFKDPRAALTLPFWRAVWSDITVVITLRNPLETARSLLRRDGMPLERGMTLWTAHYLSLLRQTTPETRIVVDYEGFCANPVASTAALLSRLTGLREADPDVARASVRAPLRHHHATLADLRAQAAPTEVLELYTRLRHEAINQAGEVAFEGEREPVTEALGAITRGLSGLDLAIRDVHVDLQRLGAVVARLETELGFVRTADLAGISALLEYERSHELPGLASALERIGQALPPLSERVSAIEAGANVSVNGRRD